MKLKSIGRVVSVLVLLIASPLSTVALAGDAPTQDMPIKNTTALEPGTEHAFIRQTVGTWDVRARMWIGPGAEPIKLSAIAERRLIGGALLEEVMMPAPGSSDPPFTRLALLSYNNVNSNYEYISWDTRGVQMMYQTSHSPESPMKNPEIFRGGSVDYSLKSIC